MTRRLRGKRIRLGLAGAVLAPALLAQGIWVRHRTPRLVEAPGDRSGVTGTGSPLGLLVTGDSAAAGVGAVTQKDALLGQLVSSLAPHFTVHWQLLAHTGATTRSTVAMLNEIASFRADVVVTSLGVNDVTSMVPLDRWLSRQRELRELLRERFDSRLLMISGLPPVHGFPALPHPLRWFLGERAVLFDRGLEQDLLSETDARFLPIDFSDDPASMAEDGFHPGPAIYREWAVRLAQQVIDTLAEDGGRKLAVPAQVVSL